ncbi:glycosyltransferase 87 family protein [Saccharopolyspora sp. NPDC000359]|uniref:glycosyltransferase 87 family protein n=1 Tax=Saccharopolyspora sp. NPDC000359 TaxID=3154251 RepID=UPI0033290374
MSIGLARARDGRHLLVVAIVIEILAIYYVQWNNSHGFLDTDVYRLGARAWLLGYDVYGDDLTPESPDSGTLPFTYPPFAVLLFVPLNWLSGEGGGIAVSVLSHLSILVTAYALARSSHHLAPRAGQVAVATALLLPWFTLIEPTRETIGYGQINLILMALVAADCLLPHTRWPRGLLVGIAAGIKLTPLGFLLLFLLRRDFRAMAVTGVTFAATMLVGFIAMPKDAADWWLRAMWNNGDNLGTVYVGNMTLRSTLAKQELTGFALNSLWVLGSVLLLVLAVLGMRYALKVANVPLALCLNAMWVLLASPISWSHHWVWAGPTLALLFAMAVRHRWYGVLYAVVICALNVVFAPQWYLPNTNDRELDWTFSQQVVGNSYTLIGIGFLVAAAVAYARFRPRADRTPEPVAAAPQEIR